MDETRSIICPHCMDELFLQKEIKGRTTERTVVAMCLKRNVMCETKQWASATTRFNYGEMPLGEGKTGPSHILQIDPPTDEELGPRAGVADPLPLASDIGGLEQLQKAAAARPG